MPCGLSSQSTTSARSPPATVSATACIPTHDLPPPLAEQLVDAARVEERQVVGDLQDGGEVRAMSPRRMASAMGARSMGAQSSGGASSSAAGMSAGMFGGCSPRSSAKSWPQSWQWWAVTTGSPAGRRHGSRRPACTSTQVLAAQFAERRHEVGLLAEPSVVGDDGLAGADQLDRRGVHPLRALPSSGAVATM